MGNISKSKKQLPLSARRKSRRFLWKKRIRNKSQAIPTAQEGSDPPHEPHESSQVEGAEGRLNDEAGSSGVSSDTVEPGRSSSDVPDPEQNDVPKIVYCDFCKYSTKHPSHLKAHLRVHTGEKPYACDACEYRGTSIANLKRHSLIHMGLKPYNCEVCGHTARSTTNLKVHMRIHSGERNFACDTCDYRTNDTTKLKRHVLKSHSEDTKRLNCEFCSFTAAQSSEFKRHMKTHVQEEKLFFCHICEYRCTTATNLKIHIRIHTGEKPFVCSACPYRARTGPQLTVHMRTHTGEKPYDCLVCGYKSKQLPSLKRHIKRLHPTYPHPDTPEVADFSYIPTGSDDLRETAGDVTVDDDVKGVDAEVASGAACYDGDVTAGSHDVRTKEEVADSATNESEERKPMTSELSEFDVKNVAILNDGDAVKVKEEKITVCDYFSSGT